MRIALLNPTFLMRRPIAELAAQLADAGHEVTIVWPMDKSQKATNQLHFDKLLKGNARITVLPIWSKEIGAILWSVPTDWLTGYKLWRLGKQVEVMQVWAPFYPMPLLPFVMKRLGLFKARLIGTYDTIPAYSFSMGRITDVIFKCFFALLTRPVLEAAETSSIYSELLVEPAVQAHFTREKLTVVPTGVFLKPKPKTADVREELDIPKDLPLVLFIGLLNKRKGIFTLMEMAALLKERGEAFRLVMIGDGPERDALLATRAALGLEHEVMVLGRRNDVHNFYHAADCFILPSDGEGLPGVVMEAMSYGRAVVSSNIPCLPDLVQDGHTGFLCKPGDATAYADAVGRLCRDETLRAKMEAATKKAIVAWDWSTRLQGFISLYSTNAPRA